MLNLKQARDVGRTDAKIASLERDPATVLTVGEQLRLAREQAGLELDEVAANLKIRRVYLEALEDGRDNDLPGHTYAVGFVRAYTDYLQLDAETIVSRFRSETAESDENTRLVFPSPMPEGRAPGGAVILIALVCAGLVYGAWIYLSSQDRSLAEIVPTLPESLQKLVTSEPADATPDKVLATPQNTSELVSSAQIAVLPQADQPSAPGKAEITPAPPETTNEPVAAPVTATPVAPVAPVAPVDAPVAPVVSIVKAPAVLEKPVVETPVVETPVVETPVVKTPVVKTAPNRDMAVVTGVRPVEEISAATPKAAISEKVAGILDTIEIPAPNTAVVPAAVMPPTPPKDDATGPRQFGVENVASRISIIAEIDSWVEVRDVDGSLLLTRLLKTGDTYKVPNRTGLKMHTGNAGGLRIEVDGIPAPGIGPIGAVRRDVALDPDALKKGDVGR